MSRMLKALKQIEARGPQPLAEARAATEPVRAVDPPNAAIPPPLPAPVAKDEPEAPPADQRLIAQAIETVEAAEAAVAVANAPCAPVVEPDVVEVIAGRTESASEALHPAESPLVSVAVEPVVEAVETNRDGSATATPTTDATAAPTTDTTVAATADAAVAATADATAAPTTDAPATPTSSTVVASAADAIAARGRRSETAFNEQTPARRFDELAEKICAQCSPRAGKVLMFTAPDDEAAGVDLMAPLAAALAARIGGDVLLVDGNPQQPDLAGQLDVQSVAGLGDVLRGSVAWPEAVRETSVPGLFLLSGRGLSRFVPERKWDCPPSDASPSDASADACDAGVPSAKPAGTAAPQDARRDLGQPPSVSALFGELSAKYRMVLIAAPSLARAGVARLTQHCRGTYLIVRLRRTSRRAVREAIRAIDRGGGRLLGCVAVEPTAPAGPSDW